jgi:hypothetical protein
MSSVVNVGVTVLQQFPHWRQIDDRARLTADTTKLELTPIMTLKLDERLEFFDCFLHVACGHGDDVPAEVRMAPQG